MGHCLSRKGQSRWLSLTLLCSLRSPWGGNDPGARAEPGPPALQGARSPSWLRKLQWHGHRGLRVKRGWGGLRPAGSQVCWQGRSPLPPHATIHQVSCPCCPLPVPVCVPGERSCRHRHCPGARTDPTVPCPPPQGSGHLYVPQALSRPCSAVSSHQLQPAEVAEPAQEA